MIETQKNLIEFLEKAYNLTRLALKAVQNKEFEQLNDILNNRERAINIILTMSERLELHQKSKEETSQDMVAFNNQVSQVLDKINQMDEIITNCIIHEKSKTQFEIAKTHKNKESFKGYNLNNIK